jgi:hypothetical protein
MGQVPEKETDEVERAFFFSFAVFVCPTRVVVGKDPGVEIGTGIRPRETQQPRDGPRRTAQTARAAEWYQSKFHLPCLLSIVRHADRVQTRSLPVRKASKQTPERPGVPGNRQGERIELLECRPASPKAARGQQRERVAGLIQSVGFVPFEQVSTRPVGQIHGRRTTEIKIWFLGQRALYRSIR